MPYRLTVASQPSPENPLLLLTQYRPSWLTSQLVWMCCLPGNVCATCSSRLSHILEAEKVGMGTWSHHCATGALGALPAAPLCSCTLPPQSSLSPFYKPLPRAAVWSSEFSLLCP